MSKIKSARLSRGLTLKQVADTAQVSIATVSKVERGLIGMRPASAKRLAAALGMEPSEIIFMERGDRAA